MFDLMSPSTVNAPAKAKAIYNRKLFKAHNDSVPSDFSVK